MESTLNNKDIFTNDITDQQEIEDKLKNLKANHSEEYLEFLLNYYLLLPPNICQKYDILKTKTEEETFFEIIKDLIDNFGDKKQNEIEGKTNDTLRTYVQKILYSPAYEELKKLNLKKNPSRWDFIYLKFTKIETETNPELIYYNLSNDLLNNIKNNDNPFEIIYFLKRAFPIFNAYKFKNKMLNNTKKFLLLLLSNCEYLDDDDNKGIVKFLNFLKLFKDEKLVEESIIYELNPENIFDGKLIKIIIKYSQSLLAKSSFTNIFQLQSIPKEIEKEIFSDNIQKYICFLNFTSFDNIGRTLKRYPLILMNTNKNKKILNLKNQLLDKLIKTFVNIVVRKFIFSHEHPHLSGCLLYYSQSINKINTPPYRINNGEIIYEKNQNGEKKGERGELFELLAYGKVKKVFNLFELLFIADERNDNLTLDEHCKTYRDYCKNKRDLFTILEKFPKNQILSTLINSIYKNLLNDKESYNLLSTSTIAYKKESTTVNSKDKQSLENSENLVIAEICPLSKSKPNYRDKNNVYNYNSY